MANKKIIAAALVFTVAATTVIPAVSVKAAKKASVKDAYKEDGYRLVWHDEFKGKKLNRKDWNVEAHEPGWVNQEWQKYPDAKHSDDVLKVKDGVLTIQPVAKKKKSAAISSGTEILKSSTFNDKDWSFSATAPGSGVVEYKDGKAIVKAENSGKENWHIQLQQSGISLTKGHDYTFTMKATSDVKRKVELSMLDPEDGYNWYGGTTADVDLSQSEISFTFNAKASSDTMALQINFGLIGGSEADSKAAVVTLSDASLKDVTGNSLSSQYDFRSGRINTEGKHNFKYGRFVTRAKVPSGKGYLPAFWLMSTNEKKYRQWPRCGEIDMMEVLGTDTRKSYHTLHYGYNSDSARQSQGSYQLSEGNFSDSWHTFMCDWEPGKITWYVDGKEVYTANDWYTGIDEDHEEKYPAPFNHEFYIILNLAVGNNWVGYPDEAAIKDMANQSFKIDYVRVYQKSKKEYRTSEKNAKRPVKEVTFRTPDAAGNYVKNGDFSQDINKAGDASENFILHLEPDGEGSKTSIKDNAVTIKPSSVGEKDYSIQLKQEGIPVYKDKKYVLTFDASAEEARTMKVDVEGPDNGWTRYMNDTVVELTAEKKSYTYEFTMNNKTDANGCLEFNLGNQGSKGEVTISNVKLVVMD